MFPRQSTSNTGQSDLEAYFGSGEGTALLALWLVYSPLFFVIFGLFLMRRDRYPIKQREPILLGVSAIGGYFFLTSAIFEDFVTAPNYPCFLAHWTIWLLIPCYFTPYPLRAIRLIFIFKLNWARYHIGLLDTMLASGRQSLSFQRSRRNLFSSNDDLVELPKVVEEVADSPRIVPETPRASERISAMLELERGLGITHAYATRSRATSDVTASPPESPPKQQLSLADYNSNSTQSATQGTMIYELAPTGAESLNLFGDSFFIRYKNVLLNCGRVVWLIIGISFLVGLVRQFLVTSNYPWNTDCTASSLFFYVSFTFFAAFIIALVLATLAMRSIRDEYNITNELKIVCAAWVLLLVPYLVIKFVYEEEHRNYPLRLGWFVFGWTSISFFSSIFWPVLRTFFPTPEVHWTNCDILSSLESVIQNQMSLEAFNEFLVSEWSVENLLFYLDVENFQTLSRSPQIVQRAAEIYEKYFAQGAVCELNIDAHIVDAIQKEFAAEEHDKTTLLHIFDEAKRACFILMAESSFPRFKKHPLCRQLVLRLEKEEFRRFAVDQLNLGI